MRMEAVRDTTKIEETPNGKGLTMTVNVRLYDDGMLVIDTVPMNNRSADIELVSAASVFCSKLALLKLESVKRLALEEATSG